MQEPGGRGATGLGDGLKVPSQARASFRQDVRTTIDGSQHASAAHMAPPLLQNEVRVIQSVSADGRNITFTSPLSFLHYGGPEYQTEVVLLSRNILLQGSPDTAGQRAGGHVRVESKVRGRGPTMEVAGR